VIRQSSVLEEKLDNREGGIFDGSRERSGSAKTGIGIRISAMVKKPANQFLVCAMLY